MQRRLLHQPVPTGAERGGEKLGIQAEVLSPEMIVFIVLIIYENCSVSKSCYRNKPKLVYKCIPFHCNRSGFFFSSPEPMARVSYCHSASSVRP